MGKGKEKVVSRCPVMILHDIHNDLEAYSLGCLEE